ncbi:DUF4241 domain-containing protein [Microbacterium sp. NPDC008134]|uniref:DUF4241 domain-containing protein n=1 Tax=Microbacterium sp. NPDC008134 TaxID=3364183 RepID=UPI0036E953C0
MSEPTASHPAEERVQKFMAEFEAQWRIAAPAFEDRNPDEPRRAFDLWRDLMVETTREHFTDDTGVNLAGSFSRPSVYGPDVEKFVRSEQVDDVFYVLTQTTLPLKSFHEYMLREQAGQWRIAAIADHYGDPTEPFEDPEHMRKRVAECGPDAPFDEMPEAQAQLDERRMFTDRVVTRPRDGETDEARVSRIGTLRTGSGVLSVLDFGYDNDDARPLARTVSPGTYVVERVTAFGRNAAVRVLFSDRDPVAWHPASIPGSGHVIGVDAGCVCIVDYPAYASVSRRAKAAAFDRFIAAESPTAIEISLGAEEVGIAVDSGYGDGSYPVYWGVDAEGMIVQLVVDFMMLVDQDDDGVLTTL